MKLLQNKEINISVRVLADRQKLSRDSKENICKKNAVFKDIPSLTRRGVRG
jgi:hypothetical protein